MESSSQLLACGLLVNQTFRHALYITFGAIENKQSLTIAYIPYYLLKLTPSCLLCPSYRILALIKDEQQGFHSPCLLNWCNIRYIIKPLCHYVGTQQEGANGLYTISISRTSRDQVRAQSPLNCNIT